MRDRRGGMGGGEAVCLYMLGTALPFSKDVFNC